MAQERSEFGFRPFVLPLCQHLNELFNGVKRVSGSVLLRLQALSVNTDEKIVTFDDGSVQSYDQLLIATGSRSRPGEFRIFFHPECYSFILICYLHFRAKSLNVPGIKLENVKMLETPEDARQIHEACVGSKVVLVGTSFVGTVVSVHHLHFHYTKKNPITIFFFNLLSS